MPRSQSREGGVAASGMDQVVARGGYVLRGRSNSRGRCGRAWDPCKECAKPKNAFLESLLNSVKCRVLALEKLQKRCDKIEAKFDKEFQALGKKYNDIYKPLLVKIQELTGEMEGYAWRVMRHKRRRRTGRGKWKSLCQKWGPQLCLPITPSDRRWRQEGRGQRWKRRTTTKKILLFFPFEYWWTWKGSGLGPKYNMNQFWHS